MEITKQQESLYTMNSMINLCSNGMEVLATEKDDNKNLQNKMYLVITSYLMVQFSGFIDEWYKHFNGTDQIKAFKAKFKPLIKSIESYKDIRTTRNTIFAHNRDKTNEYSNPLLLNMDIDYNIPVAIHDLSFVVILLQILQKELHKGFASDFETLEEYRLFSSKTKQVKTTYNTEKEVWDAVNAILKDINESQ